MATMQRVIKERTRKTYLLDPALVKELQEKCDKKGVKYSYAVEYGIELAIKKLDKMEDKK